MSDALLARAAASQKSAADPDASVFVTANAGSGKTKVLIDRVARLLLREDDPSSFLCITYTKAAAAEMQRRLFERLGAWCVMDDDALRRELTEIISAGDPMPPLAKARALFAKALETPGGLRIQTIHSFCERLLRRFPLEAGVAPGFEIVEELKATQLMLRAWGDVIERPEVEAALTRLALRLAEDALDTLIKSVNSNRRVLRSMLAPGLYAAIVNIRERHEVTQTRTEFLAAFKAQTPWPALISGSEVIETGKKSDQDIASALREAHAANDDADAFERTKALFLKDDGDPRVRMLTKDLAGAHPHLEALLREQQQRCVEALAALKAIDRAEDLCALLTLGDALLNAYTKGKKAIGALDFEDLIEGAQALLTSAGVAPWVLFKLDNGIDHILIDEGQDTSPMQWDVLSPLQSEFFAGAGVRTTPRTVFAVGDPKQSIYSFQGADPARFLAEAQALSKRAAAADRVFAAPELTMSFRSTPEVLRAVDAVFEKLPLAGDDPEASNIVRHQARRGEHVGVVEWWPLAPRPEKPEPQAWTDPVDAKAPISSVTQMAQALANHLARCVAEGALVWDKDPAIGQRPMRAGDILALVRSRGGVFDAMLKAMKAAGLPVAGADRMLLNSEIAVQDMLALARVALDEGDDLALACALKGPLIGLDDEALMDIAPKRAKNVRLIEKLRAAPPLLFANARSVIEGAIAARARHPYDFFAALLEATDAAGDSGWRRMVARLGPAARDPLEELLNRALAIGRTGPASLHHFVCAIDNDEEPVQREMESAGDAVRVMTVHGAKGLEAPVVVLADTTRPFELGQQNGLLVHEDALYWSPNRASDDEVTGDVRAHRSEANRREDWRLLYVAMTRARDRLIVCGAERGDNQATGGRAEGCWHELVEAGLQKLGETAEVETPFGVGLRLGVEERAKREEPARAAAIILPGWVRKPAPDAPRVSDVVSPSRLIARAPPAFSARALERKRFRRGRLIHGLMQRLPDIAADKRRTAGATWLKARMAPGEDGAAILDEALAVLADPRFAAVFGPGSRAEVSLVGQVGEQRVSGIIDRLLIGPTEALILDFKTDRPAPPSAEGIAAPYLAQLGLYRAVLAQAFPGRAIRCALLWTEAPALMEAPKAAMDRALAELGLPTS